MKRTNPTASTILGLLALVGALGTGHAGTIKSNLSGTSTSTNSRGFFSSYGFTIALNIKEKNGEIEKLTITRTNSFPAEVDVDTYAGSYFDPTTQTSITGTYQDVDVDNSAGTTTTTYEFSKKAFSSKETSSSQDTGTFRTTFTPDNGSPAITTFASNSASASSNTDSDGGTAKVAVKGENVTITLTEPYSIQSSSTSGTPYSEAGNTTTTIKVKLGKKPKATFTSVNTYSSSTGFSSATNAFATGKAKGKVDEKLRPKAGVVVVKK